VLVDDDLPEPRVFIADRGYDSDHIRRIIEQRGGTPVIPSKVNRKKPIPVDGITNALRNRVELSFRLPYCRSDGVRGRGGALYYLSHLHPSQNEIEQCHLSPGLNT